MPRQHFSDEEWSNLKAFSLSHGIDHESDLRPTDESLFFKFAPVSLAHRLIR